MKKWTILTIVILLFTLSGCKNDDVSITDIKASLTLEEEISGITLPNELDGAEISWISNNSEVLNGYTITPLKENTEVQLTAYIKVGDVTISKNITVTVLGFDPTTDQDIIDAIKAYEFYTNLEVENDIMIIQKRDGYDLTWTSDNTECINHDGTVTRPEDENCTATLTASVTVGETTDTFSYTFTVIKLPEPFEYTGYYEGATGLTGDVLKQFLHDLIDNHTVISYGDLRDALQDSDEDPDNPNNIILLYTGTSVSSTWDSGVTWNREHVWPRSHGDLDDSGNPANSDMHHVRPSNPIVNSTRGNLDFDEGGNKTTCNNLCNYDSDSFEPRDEVKGDVARMIFYMVVRYEGDVSNEVDLELLDYTDTSGPFLGDLSVLLQWHLNDPVDDFEIQRNNIIYSYQGNRNPFIDHPEFVEMIFGEQN